MKKYEKNKKHKNTINNSIVPFSSNDINHYTTDNNLMSSNPHNISNLNVGIINNNCQTNVQNIVNQNSINININPFGKESLEHIDKTKILSILDKNIHQYQ